MPDGKLNPNRREFTYRYSTYDDAEDYLKLGYIPRQEILLDTIHGLTAIVVEWLSCDCGRDAPELARDNDAREQRAISAAA